MKYEPYQVEDISSCVSVLTEGITAAGGADLVPMVEPICKGETVDGVDFNYIVNGFIGYGLFTEEELIENNVIKPKETEEVKVCVSKEKMNGVRYLSNMVKDENARKAFGLTKDDTADKNIRYTGKYASNKVYFNCDDKDANNVSYGEENYNYEESCEIWRIIGVFNVKSSENGTPVSRIKIVRDQVLDEEMEFDTPSHGLTYVNQWGETTLKDGTSYPGASLKQYLNDGEDSYYNSLTSVAKGQMEDSIWNTGAIEDNDVISRVSAYNQERSDAVGSNTIINYTTTWKGKIGLIYPSDWAYASADMQCSENIYDGGSGCINNNWLGKHDYYAFFSDSQDDYMCFSYINPDRFFIDCAGGASHVLPSLYLKSSIEFISGDGTSDSPFKLSE